MSFQMPRILEWVRVRFFSLIVIAMTIIPTIFMISFSGVIRWYTLLAIALVVVQILLLVISRRLLFFLQFAMVAAHVGACVLFLIQFAAHPEGVLILILDLILLMLLYREYSRHY